MNAIFHKFASQLLFAGAMLAGIALQASSEIYFTNPSEMVVMVAWNEQGGEKQVAQVKAAETVILPLRAEPGEAMQAFITVKPCEENVELNYFYEIHDGAAAQPVLTLVAAHSRKGILTSSGNRLTFSLAERDLADDGAASAGGDCGCVII